VAGKPATVTREQSSQDKIAPQSPAGGRYWGDMLDACRFKARFEAGAVTRIEVTFILPAGYDNTLAETGIYPPEAGHLLNWSKRGSRAAWYVYNLSAASTFTGGIANLEISIRAPEDQILKTNIDVKKTGVENGVAVYSGSFAGIPVPEIEARVVSLQEYNAFGATFGLGLHTNYGDDTGFIAQALADVFLHSHQLSAGVEGNPFGGSLKIPVLYAYYPGGKGSAYGMYFGDIRFSAGGLFDLLPDAAAGFRLAAGIRLLASIFEITYDFYPFDDAGYVWRMAFLYKMSI